MSEDNDDTLAVYAETDHAAILSEDRDFFRCSPVSSPPRTWISLHGQACLTPCSFLHPPWRSIWVPGCEPPVCTTDSQHAENPQQTACQGSITWHPGHALSNTQPQPQPHCTAGTRGTRTRCTALLPSVTGSWFWSDTQGRMQVRPAPHTLATI